MFSFYVAVIHLGWLNDHIFEYRQKIVFPENLAIAFDKEFVTSKFQMQWNEIGLLSLKAKVYILKAQ